MIPPVFVLFYLWMTQKSPENRVFSSKALERLRAPSVTMGLWERNFLFFAASVLLITAMAQPMLFEEELTAAPRANVLLAIDISIRIREDFEYSKAMAVSLISALEGENVGVTAYDEIPYFIAPLTRDRAGIAQLVMGLDSSVMRRAGSDVNGLIKSLNQTGHTDDPIILIPIGSKVQIPVQRHNDITVIPFRKEDTAETVVKRIRAEQKNNRLVPRIPLFQYPLGLSMLLIWIALSSMSKRRSVPLAGAVMLLVLSHPLSHAGILDFRIVHEARKSYERGEYEKSAELFAHYQKMHDSPQIRYNRANALYKAGNYAEAKIWYQRVHTTDPILAERTRYNLGRTVEILEGINPPSELKRPRGSNEYSYRKKREQGKGEKIQQIPSTRLYRIRQ